MTFALLVDSHMCILIRNINAQLWKPHHRELKSLCGLHNLFLIWNLSVKISTTPHTSFSTFLWTQDWKINNTCGNSWESIKRKTLYPVWCRVWPLLCGIKKLLSEVWGYGSSPIVKPDPPISTRSPTTIANKPRPDETNASVPVFSKIDKILDVQFVSNL